MANFIVPSPAVLASNELIVQGNSTFAHAVVQKSVLGTSSATFSNNSTFSPSLVNYTGDGMTFVITAPKFYAPGSSRPTNGVVYPRTGQ